MRMLSSILLFVLLSFLSLFCPVLPVSHAQEPAGAKTQSVSASSSTAKPPASSSEDSKYVGSDTCKTCHEDL